jgi:hypothetical protein
MATPTAQAATAAAKNAPVTSLVPAALLRAQGGQVLHQERGEDGDPRPAGQPRAARRAQTLAVPIVKVSQVDAQGERELRAGGAHLHNPHVLALAKVDPVEEDYQGQQGEKVEHRGSGPQQGEAPGRAGQHHVTKDSLGRGGGSGYR